MQDTAKPEFHFLGFVFSPFGRLSRKGFWAFAVPVALVLFALSFSGRIFYHHFPVISPGELSQTTLFRLLVVTGLVSYVLTWCLFAGCVKRLHDFGWSGFVALPLLSSYVLAFAPVLVPLIMVKLLHMGTTADFQNAWHITHWIGFSCGWYGRALVLLLALIPGMKSANGSEFP